MLAQDVKLYAINFGTMAVTMTNIEVYLKILLLLVTIGYTLSKWVKLKE
jgi:hypothetical protein